MLEIEFLIVTLVDWLVLAFGQVLIAVEVVFFVHFVLQHVLEVLLLLRELALDLRNLSLNFWILIILTAFVLGRVVAVTCFVERAARLRLRISSLVVLRQHPLESLGHVFLELLTVSFAQCFLALLMVVLVTSSGSCGLEVAVGSDQAARSIVDLVVVPNRELEAVAVHR